MYNNKVIPLLQAFEKEEINELSKLPATVTNSNLKHLIRILQKAYPDFSKEDKSIGWESICKKIWKNLEPNKNRLNKLFTEANKLIEWYLIKKEIQNSPFEKAELLRKSLAKRDDRHHNLAKQIDKNINLLQEQKQRGIWFYYKMFKLRYDAFFNVHRRNSKVRDLKAFQLTFDSLDQFYFQTKVRLLNENNVIERIHNIKADVSNSDWLFESSISSSNDPLFYIWFKAYLLTDDPEKITEILTLLNEYEQSLSAEEISSIGLILQNQVVRMPDSSIKLKLLNQIFDIITPDSSMEGFIHYTDAFLNVLHSTLHFEGIEAGKTYWKDNEKFLLPSQKNNAKRLSYALIYFYEGKFEQTLDNINNLSTVSLAQRFRINILKANSLYELGLFELLQNHLSSIRTFLNENYNLSKKRILNYLEIVSMLLNPSCASEEIIDKINSKGEIVARDWLIKKANNKR